jgi:hypothetical protein
MGETMPEEKNVDMLATLVATEDSIRELLQGSAGVESLEAARNQLGLMICVACGITHLQPSATLSAIVEAAHSVTNSGRRSAAIFILRALAVDGLLPFEIDRQLERRVVELVENSYGDQLRALRSNDKRQTFEKLAAIKGFHGSMSHELQPLACLGETLPSIAALVPDLQRVLRNGVLGSYLAPYSWTSIKANVSQVCEQVVALHQCNDATYKQRFSELENSCEELSAECKRCASFLTDGYIRPFVSSVCTAMQTLRNESTEKFSCDIESRRRPPEIAAKRYPLHIADKWLTITLPFVNKGPGIAVNVQVELDCGGDSGLALENEILHLGDVPPGEFAISFRGVVVRPMEVSHMVLQVSWGELFGDSKSIAISFKLVGQDPRIDWSSLELLEPYSLEVAEGDRFVGRRSKVQTIGNRLMRTQMSSTYITGQKRVGKTSLAQAVQKYLADNEKFPIVHKILYLEWGEYSNADPARTIRVLGEAIYSFMCSHLPNGVPQPAADFNGSIASLNGIARLLEQCCPNDRFVFILDEFDEIHPEMYRYGALAEAFFANLRTLSAKRNMAFVLVGGEKMPFIIGAQGDQLNKFFREPLDYFLRSDEWEDYVELVTDPVRGQLNWQESALNELFTLTAGHPYFTKLICSKVFTIAVAERDTEVIATDVRRALLQRISELDINAFAHFWKDGISEEREEAEVVELRRLRVLVAFGRAARLGAVTRESLHNALSGLALDVSSVGPIVDDFLRRDVLRDVSGLLSTSLPLFQSWITDVGVTKLIASTLADEIAGELAKANEIAYVKSGELIELVNQWPLYRGREITAEAVRAWLDQVPNAQDQRYLFTILKRLRFVTPTQIADLLRQAHNAVIRLTPPLKRENKVEKRRDLLVTYVDGPAKSGAVYARAYAKEAGILLDCVVEPSKVSRKLGVESANYSALVIVDDFAGTGRTIADGLEAFVEPISAQLQITGTPVIVVLLFATTEAQERIAKLISRFSSLRIEVHLGEELGLEVSAFRSDNPGIWKDEDERNRAKALCTRLGAGLYKDALGYGSQSLLIAFPEGCPNNCLPILFASRAGTKPWRPLLPRPVS